jgi:hypothetical protein
MVEFLLQLQVLFVAVLGAFTGTIELIGRYRDDPFRAVRTAGAALYILVNVAAAVAGLLLLQKIGAHLITETEPEKRAIYEVLIAGFGSLALLRSSIFKMRWDDTDVSVGPALLLDVLLAAADRGVDRRRAADRAGQVADAMRDVSFDKAITSLPPFCFAVMQNMSAEEQSDISKQIEKVQSNPAIDPNVKSMLLGLLLMNSVGLNVLREAVKQLLPYIRRDFAQPATPVSPSVLEQLLNEARRAVSGSGGTGPAAGGSGGAPSAAAGGPNPETDRPDRT